MTPSEAVLLARWPRIVRELMARTNQFPKRYRFTLSQRIDDLALSMMGNLVDATYSRSRRKMALEEVNLGLEKLRLLSRIAFEERCLNHGAFEHLIRELDECGRMVGGWLRSKAGEDA